MTESKRKEYFREYNILHKERIKANNRLRYIENREELRARTTTWVRNNWDYKLWIGAKAAAKKRGMYFNIDRSDIIIPEICPILRVPLYRGSDPEYSPGHPYIASLDRKNSELGYIKGNVWVISWLANRMKQDATRDTLHLFCTGILQNMKVGEL